MPIEDFMYKIDWIAVVALIAAGGALFGACRANKIAEKTLKTEWNRLKRI